jgi:predicted ATP-grasp superfamily ATP-dependent carboligase
MSPQIAIDLAILNDGMQRLGFYKSNYVAPIVINDTLTTVAGQSGQIQMPAEFWLTADGTKTMLVFRSSVTSGNMRRFSEEFTKFVTDMGFANVAILTATMNPVGRERQTNRQIPEVFAYCNNHLYKAEGNYYESN